jgi:DNA-binding CsgD family transcriptional regulator
MNLIESILGISNNLTRYEDDPRCSTFTKDYSGNYLDTNDVMANHVGRDKASDIIGMNDFDILPDSVASLLRKNDLEVMTTNTYKIFNECFKSLDGSDEEMVATCIKIPYKTSKNKIIGVTGFAIIQSRLSLLEKAMQEHDLTERQLECLYLLVKGKLMKQIADNMLISHRTVEHYIETIKQRMGCVNKSQLIERALSIPYIKNQL